MSKSMSNSNSLPSLYKNPESILVTMAYLSRTSNSSIALALGNDRGANENPGDSVSQVKFSPTADVLAASSWDGKVRLYEVDGAGNALKRAEYEHQGPALSCGWFLDGTKAVSGGCDNAVRCFDMQSGQSVQIGSHDGPVKCVAGVQVPNTQVVASASWDKTLKYWDARQQTPIATVQLPERAYALATQKNLLVVGCADRQLAIIDLNNPQAIFSSRQTALRMQTRSIACHSDGTGYSVGSIEGRCAISYVQDSEQTASGFAFKCHREPRSPPRQGESVYAVNSLSFHPVHNTLATAGSDGTIKFWDKDARSRLRHSESLQAPIVSTDFNRTGSLLAYGVSYDWSKGHQFNTPGMATRVAVHVVQDASVKPKPGGRKK